MLRITASCLEGGMWVTCDTAELITHIKILMRIYQEDNWYTQIDGLACLVFKSITMREKVE
jgi:hypothetical protein